MNILFYRYGSICEPDLISAFTEYGINVFEQNTEIIQKDILPAQRVSLFSKSLFERDYSFVFSINFFPELSDVCSIFNIPYMCLIVDSPILELYSDALSNPCNRIFLFDMELYREFHPVNPDCIFHIPLASNVAAWDKVINSSSGEAFKSDISFVGSLYTEKCPYDKIPFTSEYNRGYIEGLMEAQLKIYGCYFIENLLDDKLVEEIRNDYSGFYRFPPKYNENYRAVLAQHYIGNKITALERTRLFSRLGSRFDVDIYTASDTSAMPGLHNHGTVKTLTEMPLVFNHSRINLNPTAKSIRSGLPLRIFDVLGCQGFLITNYQPELNEIFNIGEHLDIYESFEDLEYKIDYYLNHENLRAEIARNGYECVKKNHTYTIRVGQMIKMAFADR